MIESLKNTWVCIPKILDCSDNIVLCIDTPITQAQKNKNKIYIYIQVEPESIIRAMSYLLHNYNTYDYILSFNDVVLKGCPNAHKYLFGTCWIPENDRDLSVEDKLFNITTIVGNKGHTDGHRFRKDVYMNQSALPRNIPYRFYRSVRNPPNLPILGTPYYIQNDSKTCLFRNSQFSIIIENSRQINYFTEKLCDCLITKTIPVYFGCPNIADFFDTTGWILLDSTSVQALSIKLECLTPEYYASHTSTVLKNYNTVKKYISFYENVNSVLKTLPPFKLQTAPS